MVGRQRFRAALIAAAVLLSLSAGAIKAQALEAETRIASVRLSYVLNLWHYSGSYWMVGNAGEVKTKVSDAVMDAYGGVSSYLGASADRASFSVDVPVSVRDFIEEGGSVRVVPEGLYGSDLNRLFDLSSLVITENSDVRYAFSMDARYATVAGIDFSDFIAGLTKSIPLVDLDYGANVYAIYGNGLSGTQADGAFDEAVPQVSCPPYIHPSDIRDSSGALKSDRELMIGSRLRESEGLSVGSGTFSGAGACGIMFTYSFDLVFYGTPADPDPGGGTGEDPGSDPGGDEPEPPPPQISLEASLALPEETYVGHTVTARDCSTYVVDGERISAALAYRNSLASNGFEINPAGNASFLPSSTTTSRDIVFARAGTYRVRLDIRAGERSAYGVKAITVLPCPAVKAVPGGTQKQNRKQTLTVDIARDPRYPDVSYEIRITEPVSGETVVVRNTTDAVCSENIKCRALADNGSEDGFLRLRLDFLTKFSDTRTLEYVVSASDNRGGSDQTSGSFTVVPDEAPTARAAVPETIYRQKGSDVAVVRAEDVSDSDDSLVRTWRLRPEGGEFAEPAALTDLSFGSGAIISFEKTGVGWFDLELTVTDVWTEETLEEYVTPEDVLSDTVVVTRLVDNVAPEVGISMRPEESAQIILAADSEESYMTAQTAAEEARSVLATEGVTAEVHVIRRQAMGVDEEGILSYAGGYGDLHVRMGSGNVLNSRYIDTDFWKRGHYTADESRIYYFGSDSYVSEYDNGRVCYVRPDYPYFIKAFDIKSGEELWSFSFSQSVFATSNYFIGAYFGHDFQGRWLYLTDSGKTMIIDKLSGSLIAVLQTALGPYNYLTESCVYSVTPDGIIRQGLSGSPPSTVVSEAICTGINQVRLYADRIAFLYKRGGEMYYGLFDPDTETAEEVWLDMTGRGWTGRESQGEAIDTAGNPIVSRYYTYTVYDREGEMTGGATAQVSIGTEGAALSYTAGGRINYVAASRMYGGNFILRLFSLRDQTSIQCTWYGSNGNYTVHGVADAAVEEAGNRVVCTVPYYMDMYAGSVMYSGGTAEFRIDTNNFGSGAQYLPFGILPYNANGGWYEGGNSLYVYYTGLFNVASVLSNSESEAGEEARLRGKWTDLKASNSLYLNTDSSTTAEDIVSAVLALRPGGEEAAQERVYKKGETVSYDIDYRDYENDDSRLSEWIYTHTPMNDGLCDFNAQVLNSPVTSFDKDGRYELLHRQMDDASKGREDHRFDKYSEYCRYVFYVLPEGVQTNAPEVKSITLSPDPVTAGEGYRVTIKVDDADSDTLDISAEIFAAGIAEPVYTLEWKNVSPGAGGVYPDLTSGLLTAYEGTHEIIVIVTDGSGYGTGKKTFTPIVVRGLTGTVGHTDAWERNRLAFNAKFRNTGRERDPNVFWPGEKLILAAHTEGNALNVKAGILEYPAWNTTLTGSGSSWSGEIWDEEMAAVLPYQDALPLTVRFRAYYKGGVSIVYDVPIVFSQDSGYWLLHRIY